MIRIGKLDLTLVGVSAAAAPAISRRALALFAESLTSTAGVRAPAGPPGPIEVARGADGETVARAVADALARAFASREGG